MTPELWVTLMTGIGVGGAALEVIKAIINGIRERARAQGSVRSEHDALHASRLRWMTAAYEQQRAVLLADGEPPPLPDNRTDPYEVWLERNKSNGGG